MVVDSPVDRRTVLRGFGTLAVAGALAGCGGDGGDGGDTGDGGDDGGAETPTEGAETPTEGGDDGSDGGGSDGGGGDVPSEVTEYLSDTDNFDGSVEDMTGQDEVTVMNGAEGNGGNFAFDPPAIRVDSGTTVVWEWTGQGGQHNVVDEDGAFESELSGEEGFTFEHTFEESGATRYFCEPHKSLGMKGAVIVG